MTEGGPAAPAPVLELRGLVKGFDGIPVIRGIDLAIREGEFLSVVGPSGSGKSTLLRLLAGLERPDAGEILLRERVMTCLTPQERPTCLVFQSLALFPHKSVGGNIEFPLKVRGVPGRARRDRARALMALVQLDPAYYRRNIRALSGGERQRVALARALAYDPEVLFFDEPLSALDQRLRRSLGAELAALQRATGKTFVYITHALDEAMGMSHRIAVLNAGRIAQIGTPDELYAQPVDRFVAETFGALNVIALTRDAGGWHEDGWRPVLPPDAQIAGEAAVAMIRPEALRLLGPGETAANRLEAEVMSDRGLGAHHRLELRARGRVWLLDLPRGVPRPAPGATVALGWDPADTILRAR
ncbi:ABC transporter ATP-binding protein [Frigidibacter sp. MR17.24]|uniref:ABC transporter ATP-binding protein n=1 Tax=Frigidibacter sp. MR17.24 TaxID=3127345 RepID=UPI003012FDB6